MASESDRDESSNPLIDPGSAEPDRVPSPVETVTNPYAATTIEIDPSEGLSDDELVRKTYLPHEKSISSISGLCWITTAFSALFLVMFFGSLFSFGGWQSMSRISTPMFIAGVFLASHAYTAIMIGRWSEAGRIAGMILSALWLLWFPLGTIVGAYCLYLLGCKKGRFVFSSEYARVRNCTGHIKYQTSSIAWLSLVILIVALIGMFAYLGSL